MLKAILWCLAVRAALCLTMATATSQQVTDYLTTIKQISEYSMLMCEEGSEGMLARQEQIPADYDIARFSNNSSTAS